jgi:hypothetical protein
MDIYTLDSAFRPVEIIDAKKSVIWTDRYAEHGEVILEVPDSIKNRLILPEGTFLACAQSREVMLIDTAEAKDGIWKTSGPSLSGFLKQRFTKPSWSSKYGPTIFVNVPGKIPGDILRKFVMPGGLMATGGVVTTGANEVIPNLSIGDEDTTYATSVVIALEPGTVYDGVKQVCDAYSMGFTLYPTNVTDDDYDLIFTTYSGKNRTGAQSVNSVVRFQPALDSLLNPSELRSIAGYKNVAYAFATNIDTGVTPYVGYAYAPGGETALGFDRRTLYVPVGDIQEDDVNLATLPGRTQFQNLLNHKAKDALANNNYVRMVDGEVVPQSAFKFGVDYNLGDIIELTVTGETSSYARVTEYIQTEDENGYSAYPTLSVVDS